MVSQGTIYNLKEHYFSQGLNRALYEKQRPGAKPKIDGAAEAHLVALVCSDHLKAMTLDATLTGDRLVSLEIIDTISHVAVGDALKK
ncbi:MAG: helix-turn-helix domain-containing protein [Ardenticatenaceae bacterium]|nr:helix-turn-helix domain-containing protein [Ardenticatenaceae bacterium]